MNNEADKQKKRNRTYKKHCFSLEAYIEATKKDPIYKGKEIDEIVWIEIQQKMVRSAINKLPAKQQETIMAVFCDEKSLRQIARERGQDISTIRESYNGAIKNLKELLKNI